ncbi:MAG: ABC transporter substrate-binding protein [Clostridiales bacterium]|nr:ABC transporter substrate-binding protein [Clostridiales bacterium]
MRRKKNRSQAKIYQRINVCPIQIPPTTILNPIYHKPMREWLTEYSFEDGYKPFDPTIASQITEQLRQEGLDGLPETDDEMIDTFGVGWWKYDVEKAAELLEKNGFTQQDGKWHLPDGSLWTIELLTLKEGQTQQIRVGFAAAESWKKFGIDVNVIQVDSAAFGSAQNTGEYQLVTAWPSCGVIADISTQMSTWRDVFVRPIGESASGNAARWDSPEGTAMIDELLNMPRTDPQMVEKTTELLKLMVDEVPFMPMYGAATFTPVDEYYWEGFPSAENPYAAPWQWWSNYKYVVPMLSSTGRE